MATVNAMTSPIVDADLSQHVDEKDLSFSATKNITIEPLSIIHMIYERTAAYCHFGVVQKRMLDLDGSE